MTNLKLKSSSDLKVVTTCTRCKRPLRRNPGINLTQWLFRATCKCTPEEAVAQTEEEELDRHEQITADIDFGDRYEIIERLGSGGMATVFRVRDRQLDRQFALKAFHDDLGSPEAMKKRIRQESQALCGLNHGNIGSVYGDGETEDGTPYLILDWIEGKTLAEVIKHEGKVDQLRALNIFRQLAEALQHAHLKGVIHRDLKPSNIVLTRTENGEEFVKIIDFGVAKVLQVKDVDFTSHGEFGEVFGTPLYMSPEQSRGEEIDVRSDIYSLGCVMYETLTGKPPFTDENAVKVILKHLKDKPVPPRKVLERDAISREMSDLVMQCLEKDPARRFQIVDELALDLESIETESPLRYNFARPKPHWTRRYLASLADGFVLTGFYALVYSLLTPATGLPPLHTFSEFSLVLMLVTHPICALYLGPAYALTIIGAICMTPFATGTYMDSLRMVLMILFYPYLVGSLYFSIFESSSLQATPGKLLFRLAVVDSKSHRLAFSHALFRNLLKVFYCGIAHYDYVVRTVGFKQTFRTLLKPILNALTIPLMDDIARAHVIDRRALKATHELQLNDSLDFDKMPLERIHRIVKSMNGALLAHVLMLGFIALCATGATKHQLLGAPFFAMIVVFMVLLVPTLFFYFQLRALKSKRLKARRLERQSKVLEEKSSRKDADG